MKKKWITLALACIMLFSLCACESTEVEKVEKLISAIGEVTVESEENINTAVNAYEQLSEKDREKVENYNVLSDAQSKLEEIQYKAETDDIIRQLTFLNLSCDYVTNSVYTIWGNAGTDNVLSTLNSMLAFPDATKTVAEYSKILSDSEHYFSEKDVNLLLYSVAQGLNPDVLETYDLSEAELEILKDTYGRTALYTGKFIGDGAQETIEMCAEYCTAYNNIDEALESISETLETIKDKYSERHSDEIDLLSDWYIESSLYADFAKNPSGSMRSYASSVSEYQNNLSRSQKTVEAKLGK